MGAQFGAVFDVRFFRVPDAEGAVGGAGRDQEARGVPGEGAEAAVMLVSDGCRKGGRMYVWEPGVREEGSW